MSKEEEAWKYEKQGDGISNAKETPKKDVELKMGANEEEEFDEVVPGFADIWLPTERGDSISGEVQEVSEGNYGIYAMISDAGTGEMIQSPAHKILQSRIEMVSPGDFVRIVYLGKSRTKTGRDVNSYRLLKKKRDKDK